VFLAELLAKHLKGKAGVEVVVRHLNLELRERERAERAGQAAEAQAV
jgi:hypothetical protein